MSCYTNRAAVVYCFKIPHWTTAVVVWWINYKTEMKTKQGGRIILTSLMPVQLKVKPYHPAPVSAKQYPTSDAEQSYATTPSCFIIQSRKTKLPVERQSRWLEEISVSIKPLGFSLMSINGCLQMLWSTQHASNWRPLTGLKDQCFLDLRYILYTLQAFLSLPWPHRSVSFSGRWIFLK